MKILIIINDAPYGTEKAYNALRMAMTLQKEHPEVEVLPYIFTCRCCWMRYSESENSSRLL